MSTEYAGPLDVVVNRVGVVWQKSQETGKWWAIAGTAPWDDPPKAGVPYTRLMLQKSVFSLLDRIDPRVKGAEKNPEGFSAS